jgi:ATP-binding cassette subfamily B protein
MASLNRLNEIFNVQPDIVDGERAVEASLMGHIEIKNLSFTYAGAEDASLTNINLSIPKGHTETALAIYHRIIFYLMLQ